MIRAERYAQIKALRDEGLLLREIGERLNLSTSTVHAVLNDPTGEKDRARKARNNGTCIDCGAPTKKGGSRIPPDRCRSCAKDEARTIRKRRALSEKQMGTGTTWSDEEIFAALRSVAREGVVTTTAYLAVCEATPGSMPSMPIIIRRFGRWNAAVGAAGLRTTSRNHKRRSDRVSDAEILKAIRACAADVGHDLPTYGEYERWAQRTGHVSGTTIRNHLGGWVAALDHFGAALIDDVSSDRIAA